MANSKIEAPKKVIELMQKHELYTTDNIWNPVKKNPNLFVIKHKAIEQLAAHENIVFDAPQIVECDRANGVATIVVTGHLDGRTEWSFGEAHPDNNKNAYPWSMAEKRAKDRVVLKLLNIHGDVYSEDENPEEFKQNETPEQAIVKPLTKEQSELIEKAQSRLATLKWEQGEFEEKVAKGKLATLEVKRLENMLVYLDSQIEELEKKQQESAA